MKKIIIVALFVAALACFDPVFGGDKKKMNPKKVPNGRTYVVLDDKNKELNRFTAGQDTSLGTDCVMIKCPGTFADDVTCWKCKESLKSN